LLIGRPEFSWCRTVTTGAARRSSWRGEVLSGEPAARPVSGCPGARRRSSRPGLRL